MAGGAVRGGRMRKIGRTARSIPTRSPRPISKSCASRAAPGPWRSTFGPGSKPSDGRRRAVEARHATAAVIGAGDYIGAAIARKFAAEGFTVFAGRRRGDKLAPLVAEIEAAGGRVVGRSRGARKEEGMAAFLPEADAAGAPGLWL